MVLPSPRSVNPWYVLLQVASRRPLPVGAERVRFKVLIKHRASDRDLRLVESILRHLKSRYVYLSYEEHDEVTANTQAVTHAAFLR
jgi:prephenate dehydrogenase